MTVNYTFANLLDKMQNSDRDIRFMATTDLLHELQKDAFKLDDDNERKLISAILKVLQDSSGEVQNLAVKCVQRAVERCKESEPAAIAALEYLGHDRQPVRKRAINSLSMIIETSGPVLQQTVLSRVIELLARDPPIKPDLLKSVLQATGALATVRSTQQLKNVISIIFKLAENEDDELRESALSALEAILRKSPGAVNNLEQLMVIFTNSIKHDPNYCEEFDDDDDEEDEEDDEDQEDYSDDDDVSWKVRRSASRALNAMMSSASNVALIMSASGTLLLQRMREREESVLIEIIAAFNTFVSLSGPKIEKYYKDSNLFATQMIKKLNSQNKKIAKSVVATLSLMVEKCPNYICMESVQLLPHICKLMNDNSPSIRLEVLSFFTKYAKTVDPEIAAAASSLIVPTLEGAIQDSFYRIATEGLRVLLLLVQKGSNCLNSSTVTAALEKLELTDIDQDVKDSTILCAGALLSKNQVVSSSVEKTIRILAERMSNEMTRMSALKAMSDALQNSMISTYLLKYVSDQLLTLSSFLRKSNRQLRTLTLSFLKNLVASGCRNVDQVLLEVPPLITEGDLYVAQLAIELAAACISAKEAENEQITQKCIDLVKSSLLQGKPLVALENYLAQLAKFYPKRYKPTVRQLTDSIYSNKISNRNEIANSAKCLAAFTYSWGLNTQSSVEKAVQPVVEQFMSDVESSQIESVEQFALLALGEIGSKVPLGEVVIKHQLQQFTRASESVKMSAAIGIGLVTSGNLVQLMPLLLNSLSSCDSPQISYLTLVSIREATKNASDDTLRPFAEDLFAKLQEYADASEEGSRNVLAECLGRLVSVEPSLCAFLQEKCKNEDFRIRQTQLATAKNVCHLKQIDIPSFLALLSVVYHFISDPTIPVIKSAIAFMNSEAHNNAEVLKRHLTKDVLESLYKETKVRPDLIREVMMGPFKHTIDDGLEIRKATFECLYSLLDSCHDEVDLDILLNNVENGYDDDYDVKLLTYLILLRIIQQSPSSISSRVVKFCEHTKKILNLRVKQDAVNQEAERSEELKRAVVRVIAHISNNSTEILIDTNSTRAYQDTIRLIQNFPELSKFLEQERKSSQQLLFTISDSKSDQMEF
ncbi:unnamed protein product [Oikopleura dioica]|uniref:TATA-binding protein interacting (TIP20) domain-containing protein n=1 Tax=Oikopleura dioica TaxID=34765 RepID=E4X2V1_OIKDI|nr:unnamed protein product [Oikopleura dioica]